MQRNQVGLSDRLKGMQTPKLRSKTIQGDCLQLGDRQTHYSRLASGLQQAGGFFAGCYNVHHDH